MQCTYPAHTTAILALYVTDGRTEQTLRTKSLLTSLDLIQFFLRWLLCASNIRQSGRMRVFADPLSPQDGRWRCVSSRRHTQHSNGHYVFMSSHNVNKVLWPIEFGPFDVRILCGMNGSEEEDRRYVCVCVCVMCFVCGRTTANRGKRSTIQWRTCNEIAAVTTVMYIHNLFARHPQGRLLVISAVVMANGMPQEFMHRSSSSWSSFSAFRPTNWIF